MTRMMIRLGLLLTLISCERFDDPIPEGSTLEVPRLYSQILGPDQVELQWSSAQICQNLCPSIVLATSYEIWRKTGSGLGSIKIGEAPSGSETYLVNGLQVGLAYEFFVIAKRAGQANRTNTVMVAPNRLPELETVFGSENFQYISQPTLSGDESMMAYSISPAGASGQTNNVFVYDLVKEREQLLLTNAQFPVWSSGSDRLLFVRQGTNSFSLEELSFATAGTAPKAQFAQPISYPVYSSDSSAVYFLSSPNAGEGQIATVNLNSGSTRSLREVVFSDRAPAPILGIDFVPRSRSIAYGLTFPKDTPSGFAYDLVGFEVASPGRLIEWEVSDWDDVHPSFSNDNPDLMAFVSNRSGSDQVWIKNVRTGRLTQVTDFQSGQRLIPWIIGLSWSDQSLYLNSSDVNGVTRVLKADLKDLLF
ncbi:TolB family protein [Algoriphagus namhaensis]